MSCAIHRAFESGDDEAFALALQRAAADDLEGITQHDVPVSG